MAITLRNTARDSIGSVIPAKSMELKHTIHLIKVMTEEIDEIEDSIKSIMDTCNSPIMTIPGISYRMGAMILAEIGDFTRFNYADQILAFAGLSPSTYQSGQLDSSYSHMEKRGSRYLRYALFNAAKFVCKWDENFGAYLSKKISTIMLLSVMQRKNWYAPYTEWNLQAKPTEDNSLTSHPFLRAPV